MQGSPSGFIDQLCQQDALQTARVQSWAQKKVLQQGKFETLVLTPHHETHQRTPLRPQDQKPLQRALLLPRWCRDAAAR
jgi:hypothetical protein